MYREATSPLLSPTYYSANRHRISVIGVVVQQDVLFHRKKNKCFSYILVFSLKTHKCQVQKSINSRVDILLQVTK